MRNRIMVGLASTALVAGMAAIPAAAGDEDSSTRVSGDAGTESQASAGTHVAPDGNLLTHLLLRLAAEDQIAVESTTPACGEVGDASGAIDAHAEAAGAASAGAGEEVATGGGIDVDASSTGDVDGTAGSHGSTANEGAVEGGPEAADVSEAETQVDADAETEAEAGADAETDDSDVSLSTGGEADIGLSFELGSG